VTVMAAATTAIYPGLLPSPSLVETSSRSPEVSLTAFSAQPPDLPTSALDG
jgi:hypothetical protein